MKLLPALRARRAFTLAELLVSSTIVVMIMGFLLTTVDQTRRTINSTTAKVGQFQSARLAFDALTRNLGQATLNTYWDMDYQGINPVRYRRQSDLHFIIDRARNLVKKDGTASDEAAVPTDAVFFQAPLGFTAEEFTTSGASAVTDKKYRALSNLLSVVGYYIEWKDDSDLLPEFIQNNQALNTPRYRYRLMEVIQPAESNMVYNNRNYTSMVEMVASPASPYIGPLDWVDVALGQKALPSGLSPEWGGKTQRSQRVLAENVVALLLIPKMAEKDRVPANRIDGLLGLSSAATKYDSRPPLAYNSQFRPKTPTAEDIVDLTANMSATQKAQLHQLPPVVQVSMVAIDEESAARVQDRSTSPPGWANGMFRSYTTIENFRKELGDSNNPEEGSLGYKLANPKMELPTPRVNYRIFTTDVLLRGSKWTKQN